MEQTRTEIADFGEFGLIHHLTKNNETQQASTMVSVGDDAAVIDHFGRQTVITTDMLVEGIHFDLAYTPLNHLGYKAVVVNLSDICAMMAVPTHITVSIALSNRFSVEALEDFYEGIYTACQQYGVDLVGGDTSTSPKGFFISITAIGEVVPGQYVTRSGAKPGDLLCVTGNLGSAYLGLQLLEREKRIVAENQNVVPNFEGHNDLLKRFLAPVARLDIVEWLHENNIVPSAMIDISDGLSSEILHLCQKSEVGCLLFEEKIPISQEAKEVALQFNMNPSTCALSGGEDYELLFTIPQSYYEAIADSETITIIGYMTPPESGVYMQTPSGNKYALKAQGWNAFSE
ncbi:MAG: thiamine-phosphate kinase [Chitinophagia bacterium]|nr:thiamine-phosphate kinase [Chitinophagia bacterium]